MPAIGVTSAAILNNANGSVCGLGRVSGVDTSAYSVGVVLYVSTAGGLTATAPALPALRQRIGTVLRVHATLGVIQVGAEADENDISGALRHDANSATGPRVRNDNAGASAFAQVVVSGLSDWAMRTGSGAANAGAWELVASPYGAPTVRLSMSSAGIFNVPGSVTIGNGLSVAGPGAINNKTATTATAAPAVATDLATVITLANSMRTRLIDFGLYL